MLFKNLRIYKLTGPLALAGQELADALRAQEFHACGSLDLMRYGFVPPIGNAFTHNALGFTMICAKREDKVLPSMSINQALEEKAKSISEAESRSIGRKERQSLKDEVIHSMLPKAFTKRSLDYAYIDHAEGLLIVNSSSAKRAEDFCSKLREALGSLKCVPLKTLMPTYAVMTSWLNYGPMPSNFKLGLDVELNGRDERVVRCKKQDLKASEIRAHIDSGMYVSKVSLDWREGIKFIIDDSLAIKRLKFSDSISEKANDRNPESKAEQFDADFCVMATQLRELIKDLIAAFGGEQEGA